MPRMVMFGGADAGNLIRTSQIRAAYDLVPSGYDFRMWGWRARTNVEPWPEFKSWAHATAITLAVNTQSIWQASLAELLDPDFPGRNRALLRHETGRTLYDALGGANSWDKLGEDRRHFFSDVAIRLNMAPAYVIPERALTRVYLDVDPRATGAMIETMPKNVAPEAMIWVHLDGVQVNHS